MLIFYTISNQYITETHLRFEVEIVLNNEFVVSDTENAVIRSAVKTDVQIEIDTCKKIFMLKLVRNKNSTIFLNQISEGCCLSISPYC